MEFTSDDIKSKCDIELDFGGLQMYVLILTHYDEIIFSEVPYRCYCLFYVNGKEYVQMFPKDSYEWLFEHIYRFNDRKTAKFYAIKFLLEHNEVFNSRRDLEKHGSIEAIEFIEDFFIENADRFSDITTAIAKLQLFYSEDFMGNFECEIDYERLGNVLKAHSFLRRYIIDNNNLNHPAQIFPTEMIDKEMDDQHEWEKNL